MLSSVLSGHKGWVTVDGDNFDRKKAAESYQASHPTQQNKMRPAWMEQNKLTHSMDVERYKKYLLDLNSKSNVFSQKSVFNLKREKEDLDQLTSGDIGKNIMKYEDIVVDSARDDFKDYGMSQSSPNPIQKRLKEENSAAHTERPIHKRNKDEISLNSRFAKTIGGGAGAGKIQNTARVRPTTSEDFWQQRNVFAKIGNHE